MKKLVIVESPNKIPSIEKYLGKDYDVEASVGHIVRLPSSGSERFGVDMETWKPKYTIDPKKQKVVDLLRKHLKGKDEVLIATDPDREGEAIAQNLVDFLKLKNNYKRIRFNEITEEAVNAAINNPSEIDHELVESQTARRILDRIIGYKLSGLMRSKISNSPISPSAGRVQSIALKLVVAREKIIEAFIPQEYYTVGAVINDDLVAPLINNNFLGTNEWIDPKNIDQIKGDLKGALKVSNYKVTKRKDAAKTPFKQAVLYKRADSTLGLSASSVQRAAQRLYEGYGDGGLISYPRTDSTRLSETFVKKAKEYVKDKYGQEYLSESIRGKAGAQDAHEAIRPTSLELTPQMAKEQFNLSSPEEKVYQLIYNNTIMALMKPAERDIIRYDLQEGQNEFKLSSTKVIFDGFLKVVGYQKNKELPKYNVGEIIPIKDYQVEKDQTKPPARYNDGSLIEKLDNIGVGRPSTFATTVNILKERQYVDLEGKALKATAFGKLVIEKLIEAFPDIINEHYTANMEKQLDEIAEGKVDYKKLLDDFWGMFREEVQSATQTLSLTKLSSIPAGKDCPVCGNPLIVKTNKRDRTRFFACSNFPECRHTENDPSQKRKFFNKKWKK